MKTTRRNQTKYGFVTIAVVAIALFSFGFAMRPKQENIEFMASFEEAIPWVLKHEGHLVQDKADHGAITNYGISYRFLQQAIKQEPKILDLIDANHNGFLDCYDVEKMTPEEAITLYREEFWDKYKIGTFANQELANKFLDLSVNMGAEECSKLFLRAFRKVDPTFGASTLLYTVKHGVNNMHAQGQHQLLIEFCREAQDFYMKLEEVHPVYKRFMKGWVARVWDGVKK